MDWAVDDIKELLTPVLGVMALLLTGKCPDSAARHAETIQGCHVMASGFILKHLTKQ